MPTPRPATCEISSAVEKPAWKMKSAISDSVRFESACIRPFSIAFSRMRSMFRPPPSSERPSCTSLPSCLSSRRISPISGFPAARRLAGDALEHRAVELDLGSLDFQVGAFSDLFRGLARNAIEALLQAAERHHAHA